MSMNFNFLLSDNFMVNYSHVLLSIPWDFGWIALVQVLCKQSQLL